MADFDDISDQEQSLYAEAYAEAVEARPPDDDWWPLARKGLIVVAIGAALFWWLGTDTMEARDAKAQWVLNCRGEAPRDLCEDVADDHHPVCYYDYARGQSWLHRADKVSAVVTGNHQKKNLYKMVPEYIDFMYVECLDKRLSEAKKLAK